MISRGRRGLFQALCGTVAIVLAGTLLQVSPASASKKPVVPAELFGMHYHGIREHIPNFRVGAIRLWDAGVSWAAVEPKQGEFRWERLDQAVANAREAGVKEIQYAFGYTPGWAAADRAKPGSKWYRSSSRPRDVAEYVDFAAALAKRYKGKITSYDMWNEGSLKAFYTGSAKQLAEMTIKGSAVIKRFDPRAKVLAPSITYGVFDRRPKFWRDFAKAMKKAKWPVDAVNVHPYSKKPNYLTKRASIIAKTRSFYRKHGYRGPVWDTEVNYGDRRNLDSSWTQIVYTGDTAAGMLARTYIDSMRTGVHRVFWYGWDSHMLGVDTIDPKTKQYTTAGIAFFTVQDWMVGNTWHGCKVRAKIRTCDLTSPTGQRTSIVYSTSKTRTYKLPKDVTAMQTLDGRITPTARGKKVKVSGIPILVMRWPR